MTLKRDRRHRDLTLGGAVHDAAIATWSVKGRYDYLRPVSALRYMAERGQRSDPALPNYHPHGFALEEGYVELIEGGDPLAGIAGEHVGEVKIWAWRGPAFVDDPESDVAGVGWIRAKEWWPYQQPTFVSPPFAGYVSGHSTFSRAAADVLTDITGSPYFPGGIGRFVAPAGEFLKFEDGPSETIELQWASYRDAADESGLSRIFGGIHPPCDDIPGRRIGGLVAGNALARANAVFDATAPQLTARSSRDLLTEADVGVEGATIELAFSEPIDSASFGWSLPDDLPEGLLDVVREGWVDGLARTTYEIELAVQPLGGERYNGVFVEVDARDLTGNLVLDGRTAGLFGLGEGANAVGVSAAHEQGQATWVAAPNPARGSFRLLGRAASPIDVTLVDATGRVVRRWRGLTNGEPLSTAGVRPGVYGLRMVEAGGRSSQATLVLTD